MEEHLQAVSVMGKLTASAGVLLSTHLTRPVENVNASDSRPYGSVQENESERVK